MASISWTAEPLDFAADLKLMHFANALLNRTANSSLNVRFEFRNIPDAARATSETGRESCWNKTEMREVTVNRMYGRSLMCAALLQLLQPISDVIKLARRNGVKFNCNRLHAQQSRDS